MDPSNPPGFQHFQLGSMGPVYIYNLPVYIDPNSNKSTIHVGLSWLPCHMETLGALKKIPAIDSLRCFPLRLNVFFVHRDGFPRCGVPKNSGSLPLSNYKPKKC